MAPRHIIAANSQSIIDAYIAGETTCSLGRKYSVSSGSIWLFLQASGVEIRKTKVVDDNMEKIKTLHLEGMSNYEIAKILGISEQSVSRGTKKMGYDVSDRQKKRDDPLMNHAEEIVSLYMSGSSSYELARIYNSTDSSMSTFLRKHGVEMRPLRRYPLNEEFFDVINTQDKAYVLGLWYADGCNYSNKHAIGISMADEDVINKVAQAMCFTGPIREAFPKDKTHKTQYQIRIGSVKMCQALTDLGCVPLKSHHATFPSHAQVPRHLQSHLLRGWHDGDGSLTNAKGKRWITRIVGTKDACIGIDAAVNDHLGFCGSVCPMNEGVTNHTTWGFALGGRNKIAAYLEWLYRDATIFMDRKKAKYDQFLAAIAGRETGYNLPFTPTRQLVAV